MAKETTIAREPGANALNAVGRRTRAFGGTTEQAVNRRAGRLMAQYASSNNPLAASDWEINNATRIGRAAARMLKR